MAQMTRADLRVELQRRGFDGFQPEDLDRFINWGHRHVARLTRPIWEESDVQITLAAGDFDVALDVDGVGDGDFPYFKSMQSVSVLNSDGRYSHLSPMQRDVFHERWLPRNLAGTEGRGEPQQYHVWASTLFILPPPESDYTLKAHYYRRAPELINDADVPITPIDYDEAVLLAAEVRCHQRARQFELAAVTRAQLDEIFRDILSDEAARMNNLQTQIIPDRRWR